MTKRSSEAGVVSSGGTSSGLAGREAALNSSLLRPKRLPIVPQPASARASAATARRVTRFMKAILVSVYAARAAQGRVERVVVAGVERRERQPDARCDPAHPLQGPLHRNRIAFQEEALVQREEAVVDVDGALEVAFPPIGRA